MLRCNCGNFTAMSNKQILYVVAGEESGDARGSEVLSALKELLPELEIVGAGGPRIAKLAALLTA